MHYALFVQVSLYKWRMLMMRRHGLYEHAVSRRLLLRAVVCGWARLSSGERMAMAAPSAAMRPVSHHDVGTNCHAGATSSGSASPLACKCIVASCSAGRRSLIADELIGEEVIGEEVIDTSSHAATSLR